MSTDGADDKARIIQLMIEIAGIANVAIAATLREFAAPASAGEALRILATSDVPVTPRDLARGLDRDPSTASLLADKLEQAGLVARNPHPTDGRKRVLVLTERGRQLGDALRDRLHDAVLLDRLTPPERRVLLDLLDRMRLSRPV
ncbi:hypothetical protein GCM10009836_48650 [Pseudonocardia ailaonensis]|uniref:HTH marR-type domain-containing protein n=1 Tax=Pseudonocardia ailaonensis TaxID=367279 RepID=A0ABN2NCY9_9PSEU